MKQRGGLYFKHEVDSREYFSGVAFKQRDGSSIYCRVDPLLNILVRAYDWLYNYYVGRHPAVTHVFRSWETQDRFYANDEDYQKNAWPSVHFYGRGTDMESPPKVEIEHMIAANLNKAFTYDPDRPKLVCCLFHNVGLGRHAHLQVHPKSTLLAAGNMEELKQWMNSSTKNG